MMNNAEIVAWHKSTAKELRAEGKGDYAKEHEEMARFFEEHPHLSDIAMKQ